MFSYIEGRNAVAEAIKQEKNIDHILLQKGERKGSIIKIVNDANKKGILIKEVDKSKLDKISETSNHQGVIAYINDYEYSSVEEILEYAKSKDEAPVVLILDGITDPHNLGAIVRTAVASGVHGVVIGKRRSVSVNSTVHKVSVGAVMNMRIARVTNITNTIKELKKHGLWIASADMDGDVIYKSDLKGALGIVIGAEGSGVGRLVKEQCDFNFSIPMVGDVESLNASVAASLIMYEVLRQNNY
ncbi:MAG: 23S rRNA (guanosine(2251)-2'-O)-methyltransferase RlmB [Clostridia bacterium]|jgi:23S rRNA (guanosine2251-2'-O)-methyltransferase|nr:23S rRNA (guanosine(2251)-2'-O)-methyltransferase RlmB [Clostridia bacterium]